MKSLILTVSLLLWASAAMASNLSALASPIATPTPAAPSDACSVGVRDVTTNSGVSDSGIVVVRTGDTVELTVNSPFSSNTVAVNSASFANPASPQQRTVDTAGQWTLSVTTAGCGANSITVIGR